MDWLIAAPANVVIMVTFYGIAAHPLVGLARLGAHGEQATSSALLVVALASCAAAVNIHVQLHASWNSSVYAPLQETRCGSVWGLAGAVRGSLACQVARRLRQGCRPSPSAAVHLDAVVDLRFPHLHCLCVIHCAEVSEFLSEAEGGNDLFWSFVDGVVAGSGDGLKADAAAGVTVSQLASELALDTAELFLSPESFKVRLVHRW